MDRELVDLKIRELVFLGIFEDVRQGVISHPDASGGDLLTLLQTGDVGSKPGMTVLLAKKLFLTMNKKRM